MKSPSLNAILFSLKLTHAKAGSDTYAHDIFDGDGNKLFTGTARDVWLYLHSAGLHLLTCPGCKAIVNLEAGVGCESCAPLTIHTY